MLAIPAGAFLMGSSTEEIQTVLTETPGDKD
jgi:formylglycine-generating enzyme required for sulfatase activity